MDRLELQFFVAVAAIAGAAVIAILHCAACAVRNHHSEHDLKVRVNVLRNQIITKKAAKQQGQTVMGEFEVVD